MTSRAPLSLMAALCTLAIHAPAQEPPSRPDLAARIGAYLEAHHDNRQFSGAALVADDGEIVYRGAFGLANSDWNIENTLATKFRVGSITKQFTAMLVLLLVEEGKLDLETPIARYLPQLPRESGSKVTIHHLLHHTSGIPRFRLRPDWRRDLLDHVTVEEFVARFCSGPLEFEPGTDFRHNNSGYYLLGAIIEAVTGQSYVAALRERILAPLEMHDTGIDDGNAVLANRAVGYEDLLGERRVAPWLETSNLFASDGLYSTVGDLWKWERALATERLLTGLLAQRMFTPGLADYGYGWHIDHHGIWHGSFNIVPVDAVIPGFQAVIGRIPARGRCVILLANSRYAAVTDAAQGIAAILAGDTPAPPIAPSAWSLAQTVLDDGIEAGLAALLELPQAIRETPRLPPGEVESTIDLLGQRLLAQRRVDEAVRLFGFNARAFPTSAQRWDSLGEAQLLAGKREAAIDNFRKAAELVPWDASARAKLERIEGR